jgi:hypothetical protein
LIIFATLLPCCLASQSPRALVVKHVMFQEGRSVGIGQSILSTDLLRSGDMI